MPINAETEESAEEIVRNAHGQFYFVKHLIFTYTIKYLVRSSDYNAQA